MMIKSIFVIGLLLVGQMALAAGDQFLANCTPGPNSNDRRVYGLSMVELTRTHLDGSQSTGQYLAVKVTGQYLDSNTGSLVEIPAALPPEYYPIDSVKIFRDGNKLTGVGLSNGNDSDVCANKIVGFVLNSDLSGYRICLAANNREYGSNFKVTPAPLVGYVCQ